MVGVLEASIAVEMMAVDHSSSAAVPVVHYSNLDYSPLQKLDNKDSDVKFADIEKIRSVFLFVEDQLYIV